ncbi:GDAP1 protein, partial [Rostratula benghalensis]|nr:GDAP1 protein [Rostratula benghalensis]
VAEGVPRLMPEEGSMYYPRVQHYRELLDSLPMDAYTHGCILHPELTVDSMIPAYATSRIRSTMRRKGFKLKEGRLRRDLVKKFFAVRVVRAWKRLPREAVAAPSLEGFKTRLDGAWSNLVWWEVSLPRAGGLELEDGNQPWLCGDFFSLADVSLAVTLHRLKFLGLARRNWGNGKRPNLEAYYERVLKRKAFHKVLGHVNNILISAVLPTAFRVAKKRAPRVLGTTLLASLLAGVGYLAFICLRKRFASLILSIRSRQNYF